MKNYKSAGRTITTLAPYALAAGAGALVGAIFGVAQNAADSGAEVVLVLEGEFALTKIGSQAWTVGQKVYWDDSNKRCTTVASGNTLVGVATAAIGSGADETTGSVRLGLVA